MIWIDGLCKKVHEDLCVCEGGGGFNFIGLELHEGVLLAITTYYCCFMD